MTVPSHELEAFYGLLNSLNLPTSIMPNPDALYDFRTRRAFVYRIRNAGVPLADPTDRVKIAKVYLSAVNLYDDQARLLDFLGDGSRARIGDHAADLRQLAGIVDKAARAQTEYVLQILDVMQGPLSAGETEYLGKVLDTTERPTQMYAVAARMTASTAGAPKMFSYGRRPNIADAWAAATAHVDGGAVLPALLAQRVQEMDPDAVLVDVTQLAPDDRRHVATNLVAELAAHPDDTTRAIMRAFI